MKLLWCFGAMLLLLGVAEVHAAEACLDYDVYCDYESNSFEISPNTYDCKNLMTPEKGDYFKRYKRGYLEFQSRVHKVNDTHDKLVDVESPFTCKLPKGREITLTWAPREVGKESKECWVTGKVPAFTVHYGKDLLVDSVPMAMCSEGGTNTNLDYMGISFDRERLYLRFQYDYDSRFEESGADYFLRPDLQGEFDRLPITAEQVYPDFFFKDRERELRNKLLK